MLSYIRVSIVEDDTMCHLEMKCSYVLLLSVGYCASFEKLVTTQQSQNGKMPYLFRNNFTALCVSCDLKWTIFLIVTCLTWLRDFV